MDSRNHWVRLGAVMATGAFFFGNAPATSAADMRYAGAADHFAGSQIAAVEGVRGPPDVARMGATDLVLCHDVSGHQGTVDWPAAVNNGAEFVPIKATEGTGFGWSGDGRTLPGALDAEYDPYGETCYGLDAVSMTTWIIKDFSGIYARRTGRAPTIYTSTSWWKRCTGNSAAFGANPLWLPHYSTQVGELPAAWAHQTIWQFETRGGLPGDQNYFNGGLDELRALTKPRRADE